MTGRPLIHTEVIRARENGYDSEREDLREQEAIRMKNATEVKQNRRIFIECKRKRYDTGGN